MTPDYRHCLLYVGKVSGYHGHSRLEHPHSLTSGMRVEIALADDSVEALSQALQGLDAVVIKGACHDLGRREVSGIFSM